MIFVFLFLSYLKSHKDIKRNEFRRISVKLKTTIDFLCHDWSRTIEIKKNWKGRRMAF